MTLSQLLNHYVNTRMTFIAGPGRPKPGELGPGPARPNYYLPACSGPARACKFQASTRPAPQNIIEARPRAARPGPWAADQPGPWAEAQRVQDPSRHTQVDLAQKRIQNADNRNAGTQERKVDLWLACVNLL